MKTFETSEIINVNSNDSIISPYLGIGQGNLSVFLNGETFEDYTLNEKEVTINLNEPVSSYSELNILNNIEAQNNAVIISKSKNDTPNAIFKKYSEENLLKKNNKYIFNVKIDNEDITSVFYSKTSPLLISVRNIRSEIGEFISDYTDQQIIDVIYNNSVDLIAKLNVIAESENEKDITVTYEVDEDGNYTFSNPRAIKAYMIAKTCIDLIYSKYFGISARYGSIKKSIGDIDVEKSVKLPYIDNLLAKYKKMLEDALKVIDGYNVAVTAVRAGDNTYESWERETTFSG